MSRGERDRSDPTASKRPDSAMRVRSPYQLEYGAQRLPLAQGELVIGRAPECDVVIDNESISRRHAKLTVTLNGVWVEDLGSVNGVFLNGQRVRQKTKLEIGASVNVADATLVLQRGYDERPHHVTVPGMAATPTPPAVADAPRPAMASEERSVRTTAFQLVMSVVDKAIALGKPEEAERLLGGLLQEVLGDAQGNRGVSPEVARAATESALKLALATKRSQWADYPVRLYVALDQVLPLELIDQLYAVSRKVRLDVALLDRYAQKLSVKRLSPAERFAAQRISSLARMVFASG